MWLPQLGYEIQAESVKIGDFQPMCGDIFEVVQDRALGHSYNSYALCQMMLFLTITTDPYLPQTTPFCVFYIAFPMFVMHGNRHNKFGTQVDK